MTTSTLTCRIERPEDDCVAPSNTNTFSSTSQNYYLGRNGTSSKIISLWRNITIPRGATIITATASFRIVQIGIGTPTVIIKGITADNPTIPVDQAAADALTRTTANTSWIITDNPAVGSRTTTANFAAVIQEIVNRNGFTPGNSIIITFEDASADANWRRVDSANALGTETKHPTLYIEWISSQSVHTIRTTGTWVAPQSGTPTIEVWGSGGIGSTDGGGGGIGGGGGGGSYAASNVQVILATSYACIVGSGGVDTIDSSFESSVIAKGGEGAPGVISGQGAGGLGGKSANSTGTIKHGGGDGAPGQAILGGGGGGSGSSISDGQTATTSTGGTGYASGGDGGDLIGSDGGIPGGGGGGCTGFTTSYGGFGQIVITFSIATVATHVVNIGFVAFNNSGTIVKTSTINSLFDTISNKYVILPGDTANSIGYLTIEEYLLAEARDGFVMQYMDQNTIITYKQSDLNSS